MEDNKISFDELSEIDSDIQKMLGRATQNGISYNSKLIYGLHKNSTIIEQEQEQIRKQVEENVPEFDEYRQKLIDLAVEHGAEMKSDERGTYIPKEEIEKLPEEYKKGVEKLNEKYKETLDKQAEVTKKNLKLSAEKIADPVWYKIPLDYFPETAAGEMDLPRTFVKYGIIDAD